MEVVLLLAVSIFAAIVILSKRTTNLPYGVSAYKISSPLNHPLILRNDNQGLGHFGAPRGGRKHQGIDFLADPGSAIMAPISGILRPLTVYATDTRWKGVSIKNNTIEVKIFYMHPLIVSNTHVYTGTRIGTAQDRASISPGMKNHIHIEVYLNGKLVDPSPYFKYSK
jgi:murein DD-endopeptidase MepM/ murein hydrolase activator NlpD